ncbi:MAG: S8 family serine peptidase [bacterium]
MRKNKISNLKFQISRIAIFALCFLIAAPSVVFAAITPNDPYFEKQWGFYNHGQTVIQNNQIILKAWTEGVDINVLDAWEIVYGGTAQSHTPANNSENKYVPAIIAIVDSGVDYNHEDIKDKILRDKEGKIIGYDFIDNDSDPMDKNGHGTMIASLAAASSNNNLGVAGVAWESKIMPVRILDQFGGGYTAKITEGIKFAADNGADIINLSIISYEFDSEVSEAIKYAYNKGAVIVAAAGNSNLDLDKNPLSPISNDDESDMIIGVGALNSADQRYEKSNFGSVVDISAPGTNLAAASFEASTKKSIYEFVSGTSGAAALVSGAAALIKTYHNNWTNKEIASAILNSASKFKSENDEMGKGRLNVFAALGAAYLEKGFVIKTEQSQTVYITIGNKAVVPIASPDVFFGLGYRWEEIKTISENELNMYSKKLPLTSSWMPKQGTAIKSLNDATIYLVGASAIQGFETYPAFLSAGLSLNNLIYVPYTIIDAYKKGETIK